MGYLLDKLDEAKFKAQRDIVQNDPRSRRSRVRAERGDQLRPPAAARVATDAKVLDAGTQEARVGRALGEIVGGVFSAVGGVGGEILGGLTTATGIGAGVGVPTIAVSTTVVVGGVANAAAGVRGLSQVLLSTGGGGPARTGAPPASMSPEGAKRQGAFNEAKRQNGIPTTQQPKKVGPNLNRDQRPQPGRQYTFSDPKGGPDIIIRDDAAGHDYGPGDPQNRGPHFNDPAGNHYDY